MTKDQFVSNMKCWPPFQDMPKTKLVQIYDGLFGASGLISTQLKMGVDIKIGELGTFKLVDVAARMGRNPSNGEPVQIPAKRKVTFTTSKTWKDLVN